MTLRQFVNAVRVSIAQVSPAASADRIRAGKALLVDVRETKEWANGHAESAILLSLSDLTRSRVDWAALQRKVGDRELILYCGAGVRSNLAARILHARGFRAINGGALSEWVASGWQIIVPKTATADSIENRD